MRRPSRHAIVVVACTAAWAAAAGCSPSRLMERFVPHDHDRFAREFLAAVRAGDVSRADSMLAPAVLRIPDVDDSVRAAAAELPAGPVDTLRLVGASTFNTSEVRRSSLTYELHTRTGGWGLVGVVVAEEMGLRFVEGFRTNRLPASLEATNDFRLAGKGPSHYLVLLLAAACLAFSLATAVAAVRTRALPRRWGWAFVALLGTSTIWLDWTTGHARFQLLSVLLGCTAVTRAGPAAPWVVAVACPVGAFAVRERIRRARRDAVAIAPAAVMAPPPPPAPTAAAVPAIPSPDPGGSGA